MEAEQVVTDSLCVRSRAENLALVLAQHGQ